MNMCLGFAGGGVVRSRSRSRATEEARWEADLALGVKGTPGKPKEKQGEGHNRRSIERSPTPHRREELDLGKEDTGGHEPRDQERTAANQEYEDGEAGERGLKLCKSDFLKYEFTPGAQHAAHTKERGGGCKNSQPDQEVQTQGVRSNVGKKEPTLMRVLSTAEGRERFQWQPSQAPGPSATSTELKAPTTEDTDSESSSSSSESESEQESMSYEPIEDPEELLRTQFPTVVDVLQTLGRNSVEATTAAQRMCSMKTFISRRVTAVELYGRGCLSDLANKKFRSLQVGDLCATDLRTRKPNGGAWYFKKGRTRRWQENYTRAKTNVGNFQPTLYRLQCMEQPELRMHEPRGS